MSPFSGWPLFGGVAVRIHHLLKALSREHEVWFVCRGGEAPPGVDCHAVASSTSRYLQLFDPRLICQLARLVRRERIEVAICSSILTGLHTPLLRLFAGIPVVFDNHNVEHLLMRRTAHYAWPVMAALEWVVTRTASRVTCVSEVDRYRLVKSLALPPERVAVFPNGAARLESPDENRRQTRASLGLDPDKPVALFFGVLNYGPNAQAVELIFDEVLPRLEGTDFTVAIAGLGCEGITRRHPQAKFLGFVDDIQATIKSCDVVIAPLLSGSGTRIKILEAAAQRRPVVSTTLGAEGLDVSAFGDYLVLADRWDGFVEALMHQAGHPPTSPLPAKFFALYDWETVFQSYLQPNPQPFQSVCL